MFATGDYVRVRTTNQLARVFRVWDTSTSVSPFNETSLLNMEADLGPQPLRFINERWYGLLLHGNGSKYMPESLLETVEAFQLNHPQEYLYFPDVSAPRLTANATSSPYADCTCSGCRPRRNSTYNTATWSYS